MFYTLIYVCICTVCVCVCVYMILTDFIFVSFISILLLRQNGPLHTKIECHLCVTGAMRK